MANSGDFKPQSQVILAEFCFVFTQFQSATWWREIQLNFRKYKKKEIIINEICRLLKPHNDFRNQNSRMTVSKTFLDTFQESQLSCWSRERYVRDVAKMRKLILDLGEILE